MKTRLIGAILAILLTAGGALVLTDYVRAADVRAANGAALVAVYVVSTTIPEGTAASELAEFITEDQLPANMAVPDRVTSLAELDGLVASTTLLPGEQLLSARWVSPAEQIPGLETLPDGMQAISIAVPAERVVGGLLAAGDTVGVVITSVIKATPDAPEVPVSRQVFHRVLVLAAQGAVAPAAAADAVDAPSASQADAVAFDSTVMITLALPTADVERLVWGQQFGTVWLTRELPMGGDITSNLVDAGSVFQ